MPPITWQNVNGPSLAEASRPLDSAARAFDMGFGALRGVLDQRNAIDTQNFQTGKTNNANTYLDRVAQLRTLEQAKAAQASGVLDQLKASFGGQIDSNAVRGALDNRITGLMTQEKQAGEFQNWQTDFNQAGERDAILSDINSGDPARIAAGRERLAASQLREKAALSLAGNTAGYQQETRGEERADWGRKAQDQVWQGEAHKDGLASSAVQRQTALGNLAVNQGQLGIARDGLKLRQAEAMSNQAEKLENRMAKLREERGETMAGRAGSVKGIDLVNKQIASLEDPDDREVARAAFNKALKANPNATTESVLQATLGVRTAWNNTDSGQRQLFVDTVKESMASGAGSEDQVAAEQRRSKIDARLTATQEQLDKFGVPSAAAPVSNAPVPANIVLDNQDDYSDADLDRDLASGKFDLPNSTPAQLAARQKQAALYYSERASVNQAQEQRQAIARARTAADKAEFKAEERKRATRSLQVFENQIKALNKSDPSRNRDITLERAKAERDRLKQLLGK